MRIMNDFFVESSCYLIKEWNHFRWEIDESCVKFSIMIEEMLTVNIKHVILCLLNIPQLLSVVCSSTDIIRIQGKIHKEKFEVSLYFFNINISSPKNLDNRMLIGSSCSWVFGSIWGKSAKLIDRVRELLIWRKHGSSKGWSWIYESFHFVVAWTLHRRRFI